MDKDYKNIALEWFLKAANQGHANAQYKIAELYYNGFGDVGPNFQ
jgi:TPR repeat protein